MTEEEKSVITTTPRHPDTAFNFGPASALDEIVFTSERPGGDPPTKDAKIPISTVQEWADFMKGRDIQHVLVLLDDHELEIYEEPGLLAKYEENGFRVHRNPMNGKGSVENAEKILKSIASANEKVVCHCTHGMGRSGRVAAGWLVLQYGLTPQEATREALQTSEIHGMERMGNVQALSTWLENK